MTSKRFAIPRSQITSSPRERGLSFHHYQPEQVAGSGRGATSCS